MSKFWKLLALFAIVPALFLAGCSSASDTAPEDTKTVYVTPTPEDTPDDYSYYSSDEEDYLWAVRDAGGSIINNASDDELLELGWNVCAVLDEGYSVEDIIYELVGSGTVTTDAEAEFAGTIVGGAVFYLCIEHSWQV